MDRFEWTRLAILAIGWPILILGSVRLGWQAKRLYEGVGRTSFGRLVAILVAGLLVTMYSLGVIATALMWLEPERGVPVVLPVFAGWFMLMLLVWTSMGRWTAEVAKVNSLRARMEEASRARVDLINRASHELSTPLTPLVIQAQLLANPELGPLTPRQQKALTIVQRNLDRLTFLVREMMDVARLQTGHLHLLRAQVDLSDTLREGVDSYRPRAKDAGLSFEHEIEEGLYVEADPVRVTQILENLLANAIQFTPRGGSVRLVARRRDHEADVWVEDTGVGFGPEDQPKLFQPFSEMQSSPIHGGIGLGLYIARTLVEAHGGRVWARSEGPGKGATFGFYLPLTPKPAAPANPAPNRHLVRMPHPQ